MQTTTGALAIACSLSPADYAQRLREFRRLFASSLQEYKRQPTRLGLVLVGDADLEATVRDLLRREQECCPFFSFAVDMRDGQVQVVATVPDGADECLADLERLAARVTERQAT